MDRALDLFPDLSRIPLTDWLRAMLVYGCAMALIVAGPLLPLVTP